MVDDGIVKKSTVFFIVTVIVVLIGLLFYFLLDRDEPVLDSPLPSNPSDVPSDEDHINETGIYGLFVNVDDAYSYFEYKEDGNFVIVLNMCEGYFTYNNDNSVITKNIEVVDDVYNVTLSIKPKSNGDKNVINLTSNLVSSTGEVAEYTGPYSCSPSYNYKRA